MTMNKNYKFKLSKLSFILLTSVSLISCGGGSSNSNNDKPEITEDTTPDAFSFQAQSNLAVNTLIESNSVTITGINSATKISISGGEYAIDNNSYTSSPGTINNNQNIKVRATTAETYSTLTKITLTVGELSKTFEFTTKPEPVTALGYQVDVNLNVSHTKGGVDSFDRSRYITMHIATNGSEWPDNETQKQFIEDYDVYYGRNNGALPWQLKRLETSATEGIVDDDQMTIFGNQTKSNYINSTHEHQFEDRMANMMYGGQPVMYPHQEKNNCNTDCYGNTWLASYDEYGRFLSEWLNKYFGSGGTTGEQKPKIIEVMNEPFVHSGDLNSSNANITELHKVVAQRIHQDHPNVKVGGYTAAYPALEANNSGFQLFDNTWKTFIDGAGEQVDFYSIHLYDGHDNSNHQFRSGSNVEAILDMIEQYSVISTGDAKPWVISEYGFYSPHYKSTPYSKQEDWWNIRSFSSIMMQLMDKPDQIMTSMPFFILKALWSGNAGVDSDGHRYPSRLFVLKDELDGSINVTNNDGEWVFSEMEKFYQLWSEVKGKRIDSKPSDLDLQTDAYVDGNTLYLIVNNLEADDVEFNFNLNENNNTQINSISYKHLYYNDAQSAPELAQGDLDNNAKQFTVNAHATSIIKITYASDIVVNETSTETKYYADKFKQQITANNSIQFAINDVQTSTTSGEAVLRLGLGRAHNLSLEPTITVNGTNLIVPKDFRGYDQKTRDSFFGVIEIPVPYHLLQKNNTIDVRFDDTGGYISSMTMQVFETSAALTRFN